MNRRMHSQRDFWNQESESFQKIYTHEKSKLLNFLDRVFRKTMWARFEFTFQHCEPIRDRMFLDIGCGSGQYSVGLVKRGASKVIGIDIAENMVHLAKQLAEEEGAQNRCTFLHTDLLQYEPECSFDVSIAIGLFDYISHPVPILKKMRQVTTDKVIIAFPRYWTWRAPVRKVRLFLKGCDVYFYSKGKVARLMKEAGFQRYEIHAVGTLHCVVGFSTIS